MNAMMLDAQTELMEVPLEGAIPRNQSCSWHGIFSAIAEVPGAVWTMTSMALSIAVYSAKLGWNMAAGLVALLMIHECGHLVAAFLLRIPISAPIFIPYLGAVIDLKEEVCNRWNLALLGIAGPIAGTVASLGCYMSYKATGSMTMVFLALGGCIQNLFNLIPMGSLDGGHIVGVFTRWIWIPGYLLMCCLAWFVRTPAIWISLLVMLPQIIGVFRPRSQIRPRGGGNYRRPSLCKRIMLGIAYVGLVCLLTCCISLIFIRDIPAMNH